MTAKWLYDGIKDLEHQGQAGCVEALGRLEQVRKLIAETQASGDTSLDQEVPKCDLVATDIAMRQAAIKQWGDRMRSNIRQFAALCFDTQLEEAIKREEV